MALTVDVDQLGFDPDELRARYRAERDSEFGPRASGNSLNRRVNSRTTSTIHMSLRVSPETRCPTRSTQ